MVRIYRYDPEDERKITGLIKAVDGSGVCESFTDAEALGAILSRLVKRQPGSRRGRERDPEAF